MMIEAFDAEPTIWTVLCRFTVLSVHYLTQIAIQMRPTLIKLSIMLLQYLDFIKVAL